MSRGLSTAGFMDGAMKGYSFMQGVENNKLRNEEIVASRGLRDADESRRAQQFDMQKEAHAANLASTKEQQKLHRLKVQDYNEEKAHRANTLFAKKARALQNNGLDWTPENQKALSEFGRLADPEYLMAPETGQAIATIENVFAKKTNLNDPAVIAAANRIFNVQRGAQEGNKVSINRIVPAKDGSGVHFGLRVTRPDGTEYDAPMTNNGTSKDDDEVTTVSMDEFMDVYGALKQSHSALSNPKMRQAFIDFYDPIDKTKTDGWSDAKLNEGTGLYEQRNLKTGQIRQLRSENGKSGRGAGSASASALEKEVEYLKSIGLPQETALDIATNSKQNPSSSIIQIAKVMAENEQMPINDAIEQAKSIYQEKLGRKLTKTESNKIESAQLATQINQVMKPIGGGDVPIPMRKQPAEAPAAAIEYLKANPDQAEKFKAKYGYLPE